MVKVYRPDGVEVDMDTVDARECVAHCEYSYEPPVPSVDTVETTDAAAPTTKAKKG